MAKGDSWLVNNPLLAAAVLAVSCERCGAAPNQRCRLPDKSIVRTIEAKTFHAVRIRLGEDIIDSLPGIQLRLF